jgi:hypothetical protein
MQSPIAIRLIHRPNLLKSTLFFTKYGTLACWLNRLGKPTGQNCLLLIYDSNPRILTCFSPIFQNFFKKVPVVNQNDTYGAFTSAPRRHIILASCRFARPPFDKWPKVGLTFWHLGQAGGRPAWMVGVSGEALCASVWVLGSTI